MSHGFVPRAAQKAAGDFMQLQAVADSTLAASWLAHCQ